MDIFSKETFVRLASVDYKPCISIYLPTHRAGKEVNEGVDRTAYKNALNEVERELENRRTKPRHIKDLLTQAWELYDDGNFWRHQSDTLAVFIAQDFHMHYSLPLTSEPLVKINTHLYLSPLLPLLVDNQYYYILSLAKGSVKLYEATPYTITEIIIGDLVPKNMEEALRFDDPEKSLQHHSGAGAGQAIYHGQGGAKDVETENLQRYLNVVDKGIYSLLVRENAPVILAGDKNVTGEYKKLSQLKQIMDETVQGNVEYIPAAELHEMTKPIVNPFFGQTVTNAVERYHNLAGTGQASADIRDVIKASYMEKIETLLIKKDAEVWGYLDMENFKVRIHADAYGTELVNQAAVQTILHGGNVHLLNGDMPGKGAVAAIYRY